MKIALYSSIYTTGKRAFIKAMNSNPGIVISTAFTEGKIAFKTLSTLFY